MLCTAALSNGAACIEAHKERAFHSPPLSSCLRPAPPLQVAAAHRHLDLLINATGVLHDSTMSPETALARVTMENLLKCFQASRCCRRRAGLLGGGS